MWSVADKTGMRFGMLTVIEQAGFSSDGKAQWLCRCDCGNYKVIRSYNLRNNSKTRSCGCYKKKCLSKNKPSKTHGMTGTRLHRIWGSMKWRCYSKTNAAYKYYGARGISVCDEWKENFTAFYEWAMANGYSDDLTIDRIDVNGNYEPDNCRWVSMKIQDNNKRNNRYIEHEGVTHTAAEWADILDADRHIVSERLNRGWNIKDAVTKKPGETKYTLIEINGVKKNVSQWATEYNKNPDTILKRIEIGWDPVDAVIKDVNDLKLGRGISINGKKKSISEWAKEYGISRSSIYHRINKLGWDPVKAITEPTKKVR